MGVEKEIDDVISPGLQGQEVVNGETLAPDAEYIGSMLLLFSC